MEHYELWPAAVGEELFYRLEHVEVAEIGVGRECLFKKLPRVGFAAEDVDKRVVGPLVGQECGVESGFAEGCDYPFLAIYAVIVSGTGGREQHGHALVGGVGLGVGPRKLYQTLLRAQEWRGVAVVAVEAEVFGPGCLAYHQHVYLGERVGLMGGYGLEGEVAAGLVIGGGAYRAVDGEIHVVAHVEGIETVLGTVVATGIAHGHACRSGDGRGKTSAAHEAAKRGGYDVGGRARAGGGDIE